jgi:hypothetical protein
LHRGQDSERDQVAIGRSVGDVAGVDEQRLGERTPHGDQILGGFWHNVRPGGRFTVGRRRGDQDVLPGRVEVAVVPGDIFPDHRLCRRMRRHIRGEPFAQHPNLAAVAQRFAVFGAGSHYSPFSHYGPERL